MKNITRILAGSAASLALMGVAIAGSGAVDAKGSSREVRITSDCTGRSDWKLKVKPEDGRMLEAEFEVDQNVVGARWQVVMKNDGATFFSGIRTTTAPSGSFSVERLTADGAGADVISGYARNLATGETCRASISF